MPKIRYRKQYKLFSIYTKIKITLQWLHNDVTLTLPLIHTSQDNINNTNKTHKHEILLPKVILKLTWVCYEETTHTIPSYTPERSLRLPMIRSFSLHIIVYIIWHSPPKCYHNTQLIQEDNTYNPSLRIPK